MKDFNGSWKFLISKTTVLAWVLAAILSVLEFIVALTVGNITGKHGLMRSLVFLLVLGLLIFTGRTVVAYIQYYFSAKKEQELQERVITDLIDTSEANVDLKAELHYLTTEARAASKTYLNNMTDVIVGLFSFGAAIAYGFTISRTLTLLMLFLCCVGIFVPRYTAKVYQVKQKAMQEKSTTAQDYFINFMDGKSVFKAFGARRYAIEYFTEKYSESADAQYEAGISKAKIETLGMASGFLFDIAILGVELLFVGLGRISIFQYAALAILTPNYTWLFYTFPSTFAGLIEGLTPAARIVNTIKKAKVQTALEIKTAPATSLSVNNVSFGYSNAKPMVLKRVSFKLNALQNEKLMIVGPSGGGKTTLLKLILGEYMPSGGSITIGLGEEKKRNLTRYDSAYVPQSNVLIPASLRNNILLGRKVSEDEYLHVLTEVGLVDLVAQIHTRGRDDDDLTDVSAGQVQKIGIARALISNRSFLLMDEPFANLDIQSRENLSNTLKELKHSVIVVSHQYGFSQFWTVKYTLSNGYLR
ncbi:ATP-binding cassette domain-containing protein [Lacticaseibacillus zhaodongensis]|uniref:ATP-binding cassette domain-containing protein n=1 Tax=Lacticaseibacillus zhaodongensis TaxID=2668065 RepID=UPI0012D2B43B|nr:ABC transporter ATP-binding protein [Lacticaseibacillus zhaodongensis]